MPAVIEDPSVSPSPVAPEYKVEKVSLQDASRNVPQQPGQANAESRFTSNQAIGVASAETLQFVIRYNKLPQETMEIEPDCEERSIESMTLALEYLKKRMPKRDTIDVDLPDF